MGRGVKGGAGPLIPSSAHVGKILASVLGMETLVDPQNLRVKTTALDFMTPCASMWGNTFNLLSSHHTPRWAQWVQRSSGLSGQVWSQVTPSLVGLDIKGRGSQWSPLTRSHDEHAVKGSWRVRTTWMRGQAALKKHH